MSDLTVISEQSYILVCDVRDKGVYSIIIKLNPKPLNIFALFYYFEETFEILQIAYLHWYVVSL